ncbi:MAG: hypothetical protein IJ420_06190 [Lachnospiraceae bacterium]|nr:hypothetical protein [Lachnospiraceae bacterium]
MFDTIDQYKLNPYSRCLMCENRKHGEYAKSCKVYPKQHGIPPKIWNGKYAECEHYIPEKQE